MKRKQIAVLGDGQMGLFCAATLAGGSSAGVAGSGSVGSGAVGRCAGSGSGRAPAARVTLWGHDPRAMGALAQTRLSPRLVGYRIPEVVRITGDDMEALETADLIVSAVPVQFLRHVWIRVRDHVPGDAAVVSVAKGIENGSLMRPTQVIADVLSDDPDRPARPMAVLSGPTIAAELARCLPATMIAASDDAELAADLQSLFTTHWLRIYTGTDPLGVEIAGATKNVIAIAAGILDGLHAGFNAKSALLARGLAEIARLGLAMGARAETFFGLAGVGDLATTCFSPEGRNRSCGEALGRGEALSSYLGRTDSVVEGVATTRGVMDLARKFRVEMPITAAVHAVLYEGLDPLDAITRLMSREPKEERVG